MKNTNANTKKSLRGTFVYMGSVFVSVAVGVFSFACDKVYADPVTEPFSASSGFGFDSGLTSTRIPPTKCPDTVRENGPCASANARCESGKSSKEWSADPRCNSTFVCAQDVSYGLYWTESTTPSCAGTCPDPGAIQDGAPCEIPDAGGDDAELQCSGLHETTCACTTGPDGAHSHPRRWVCVRPQDQDTGCDAKRPLLGRECVGEHVCDYGACEFKRGVQMICQDEVWQIEVKQCK